MSGFVILKYLNYFRNIERTCLRLKVRQFPCISKLVETGN
jgi:hypothetical protein